MYSHLNTRKIETKNERKNDEIYYKKNTLFLSIIYTQRKTV
jgi:hypothetical protein